MHSFPCGFWISSTKPSATLLVAPAPLVSLGSSIVGPKGGSLQAGAAVAQPVHLTERTKQGAGNVADPDNSDEHVRDACEGVPGLPVYLFTYLPVCLPVGWPICIFVRPSICPSVHLPVRPFARLSVCPSVHLPVRPSVCLEN